MRVFDTHAHLLDEAFDEDRFELIGSLPEKGITCVMEACCDEKGIDRVIDLVARVPFFYGSAGVHPHSADEWNNGTADHIRNALKQEKMLAVGEIGLDYHYDFSPRDVQKKVLDEQLSIAGELGVPVILHDREAHGDMMDLLRAHKNGLKGVFINGSSGEGYMLTEDERMRLAEAWIAAAPEGFKVIVHVGSCCVRNSRMLAEHAQKIGAWGIGAMAPPFPKIGRIEELVKYCEEIAAGAPDLPFYYYHIPAFNGAYLPMVQFLQAVDGRIPNFAGIKYTFESIYEYNQCRLYAGGKFDMLHGQDETILPSLAMGGARGGIGGTTNYNGRELVGIVQAWNEGDIEMARERQNFSQLVINVICHFRGNIVGGKRIMKLIGLDLGPNRTPFQNMTAEEEVQLRKELEEIGFFQRCNQL